MDTQIIYHYQSGNGIKQGFTSCDRGLFDYLVSEGKSLHSKGSECDVMLNVIKNLEFVNKDEISFLEQINIVELTIDLY